MKNVLLSFVLITLLSPLNISYAHNTPIIDTDVFTIESINFEMNRNLVSDYAMEIVLNKENGNLEISLNKEVSYLQVLNADGYLEFQLPVFSKSVILDLDDFNTGDYKMEIKLDSDTVIPATFTK